MFRWRVDIRIQQTAHGEWEVKFYFFDKKCYNKNEGREFYEHKKDNRGL